MEVESEKQTRGVFSKMPKAVFFILCSIFFERYTSGGIAGTQSEIIYFYLDFMFSKC